MEGAVLLCESVLGETNKMSSRYKWKKARKKPVIVEFREVQGEQELVETLHGLTKANHESDYIVKTIRGDLYPCDKLLFHKMHEVLEE